MIDKIDTRTLEMLERVRLYFKARTNEPVVPAQRMTQQEWKAKFESAVQDCYDSLRGGTTVDWVKHRFILRKTAVIRCAEERIKAEDKETTFALLEPVLRMNRTSACQYLMFLCLLLGLFCGKPLLVSFKDETTSISEKVKK